MENKQNAVPETQEVLKILEAVEDQEPQEPLETQEATETPETQEPQEPPAAPENPETPELMSPPEVQEAPLDLPVKPGFPIVGIGASAGGLEAFEQFFRNIPVDTGMAFVLVAHLDPSHASILTEIIQRVTNMPVVEARDQRKVVPNSVYVIPPNRDMSIFHGVLQLSVPEQPRGQRMPIDAFLRSLAEDQGERAIGIILSGTGTDGTLGLRAILGAGGVSLVQEPSSAKYDGMPNSAIHAGYATHVLLVENMPEKLGNMRALNRSYDKPSVVVGGLNRILMQLRNATGHDFTHYKKSTIGRRIERRMAMHNIEDREVYARYMKEHLDEANLLFKELLINVTNFFRDPEAYVVLKQEILPQLFADKPEDYVFRVWVAGCATGEEAYSVAILLREYMDELDREYKILLYATDLDDDAIVVARAGIYTLNIAQDVLPERLRRYFVKEEAGYRVKKIIREMVVFAIQSVIKDPPFTKLDLLCCRNLMIYLEPEIQNRLIPSFHYALKPGGVLFLSPSESITGHPDLFELINRKWKFYKSIGTFISNRAVLDGGLVWVKSLDAKAIDEVEVKVREINYAELTRTALLQSFAPASVVIDIKGNLLYVHGDAGNYLRPAPGQATLNVIKMAREGLQLELRAIILLSAASPDGRPQFRELSVKTNGHYQMVKVGVRTLHTLASGEKLLLVSFQNLEQPVVLQASPGEVNTLRVIELERELAYNKENLQATVEEQQASNEELQSTNEELQSTNEELETSKEELQSVNEELVTVNSELQAKVDQLAGMQNDMKNLLDNVNVGTIFLDEHLLIRRYTRDATRVYRLVATDVGRPLSDIKSDIDSEVLLIQAQQVLETLLPWESELSAGEALWYLVRIRPYRTLDNVIDGVVLTFTDISQRIVDELAVRNAQALNENIVNTLPEPLLVLDSEMRVVTANRSFYQFFKATQQDTLGLKLYQLGDRQWDIPELRKLLEAVLPDNQVVDNFMLEHEFPVIGNRRLQLKARRIEGQHGNKQLILLTMNEQDSA